LRRLVVLALLAGCGDDDGGTPARFPETLAEWNLFSDAAAQAPADDVVPYQVIASLWADYAVKHRFIRLPAGATITYDPLEKWGFPVGALLIKTFAYDTRLLETRLLVREEAGWTPITYVWNEAQTEARYTVAGARIPVSFMDLEYRVPNTNQCLGCHGDVGETNVLGPRTRQLDRDGQLESMAALGMFDRAPEPAAERVRLVDPLGTAPVAERARSYLDANCAHCHNPTAAAQSTGLRLNLESSSPEDLGICRLPFSAGEGTGGRLYDVVPGHPEESIVIFRMQSTEPEIKMPEFPSQLSDPDGVAVVSQWIAEMTPEGCP
jgi:uncharacterized repeat protein (TIGR03806 family)